MTAITKITSRDNDRLKLVRRVRDGREDGKIFLEGIRLVTDAFKSGVRLDDLYITAKHVDAEIVREFDAKKVYELPDELLQSIADTQNAQGMIATATRPTASLDSIAVRIGESAIPVVVLLHEANNPSNLGAVIRTAEAAGAAGVIVSSGSADPFSPKALRSAMGSTLRLPVCEGVSLDQVLSWATAVGLQTTAADIHGRQSYASVDWSSPRLLVMGSEAHGLSDEERAKVESLIVIPFEREVESLNLAVACGVILFEARRQNPIS